MRLAQAAALLLPLALAAPRFIGGGAIKMYSLEMALIATLLAKRWVWPS